MSNNSTSSAVYTYLVSVPMMGASFFDSRKLWHIPQKTEQSRSFQAPPDCIAYCGKRLKGVYLQRTKDVLNLADVIRASENRVYKDFLLCRKCIGQRYLHPIENQHDDVWVRVYGLKPIEHAEVYTATYV